MSDDSKNIAFARERFAAAKSYWSDIYDQYTIDARAVNVKGGQWDKKIRDDREAENRPALEFNELAPLVTQISNRARQERPQPKIVPGDDGDPNTARMLGDKLRHCQYASQADVAYDTAVEAAASGGFGFYEITREYVSDRSFNQEPRVKRILDPTTILFDPAALEPDFSDAAYAFKRWRMRRADFELEFGLDPMSGNAADWSDERAADWADDEYVWVAAYWHIEKRKSVLCALDSGELCFEDELQEGEEDRVLNRRPVTEKTVYCDTIDGEKLLERDEWPGQWIPLIPVLGREVIVEGRRHLISAVRFALDAQKLKNAYKSGIAEMIGTANFTPFIGYKGQFKDAKWRSNKKHLYLEVEPTMVDGKPAPLPQRGNIEPPIQALSAAAIAETDDIKRAVGYIDAIVRPSQNDISGAAVTKRDAQQQLTNYHIQDNLLRSQWHAGRVMLELLLNLTDTPRAWNTMREDGTVDVVPVTLADQDGNAPQVPGHDKKPHHRIDVGEYHCVINSAPSYASRLDEMRDAVTNLANNNPQAWALYGDIIWKLLGYPELEERAKLGLAPQVQQAISSNMEGVPPQAQAMIAGLQGRNQQMQQALQRLMQMIQSKQIEAHGKIDLEKLKLIRELMVEQAKQGHDFSKHMLTEKTDAVEHLMGLLHESELAPDPNAPPAQPIAA